MYCLYFTVHCTIDSAQQLSLIPHLHSAHFRGSEQGSGHGSGQHEYVNM
jgi:hypothetical protein